MKAAVLYETNRPLQLRDLTQDPPLSGEVRLEMGAAGVYGSDRHFVEGIDVSRNTPKLLTQEMVDLADRVITMGCSFDEACPASTVPTEDWGLEDPSGKPAEAVRGIRNEIAAKVKILLTEFD